MSGRRQAHRWRRRIESGSLDLDLAEQESVTDA
jgi:hypothetical protein